MLHKKFLLILLTGLAAVMTLHGQKDYRISFSAGELSGASLESPESFDEQQLRNSSYKGKYYCLIQFFDIPTQAAISELNAQGIELGEYIPNYAYIARVPIGIDFNKLKARSVSTIPNKYKLSKSLVSLGYPAHIVEPNGLRVKITAFHGISSSELFQELLFKGYYYSSIKENAVITVVPPSALLELAAHPAVMFIEPGSAPAKTDGYVTGASNRTNVLTGGPGIGFDGSGVSMAIADDGSVSHIDFKNRITDFTSGNFGNHGDMTAGMSVGCGNLNPAATATASGSHLYLYQITDYPHVIQAAQNYIHKRIVVTSTSYSEECGGIYTSVTRDIDDQYFQQPQVLHFFSAGNNGMDACSNKYGHVAHPSGRFFGNITGGRKSGKQPIAVGNLDIYDNLIPTSSIGPAEDGRIKPDLVSNGQGSYTTGPANSYRLGSGTSAAAPGAAGLAASLYQAYRLYHNNEDPPAALIKAILLNTAEDMGEKGPDYMFGWGKPHGLRALQAIENHTYVEATINHAGKLTFPIEVPFGVRQLKVMLYWADPAGTPMAGKALVNDLDLSLKTPQNHTLLPWALSSFPHLDSLSKPAFKGKDRLNNMEQVAVENPDMGKYWAEVHGFMAPKGPQTFFVVYSFITDDIQLTYPGPGEQFVPGEKQVIRWDALGKTGSFLLEYQKGTNGPWIVIAQNIPGEVRNYEWETPHLHGGDFQIRLTRNGKSTESGLFNILGLPSFDFEYISYEKAKIVWDKVPGADHYEVYALGEKYMDLIGATATTELEIDAKLWQSKWYSVKARAGLTTEGRRSVSKEYTHRPCQAKLFFSFKFDLYPGETSWYIKDTREDKIIGGGPYYNQPANGSLEIQECLPLGCYTLVINDKYGDGICCLNGNGSFHVKDGSGNTVASGGAFGNAVSFPFCVQENSSSLVLNVTKLSDVSCFQGNDGVAQVFASGGAGQYTYEWDSGEKGATAKNLKAGIHVVTVSDGLRIKTGTVAIEEPSPMIIDVHSNPNGCGPAATGSASAWVSGGTLPYTYLWNNGFTQPSIDALLPGSYSVTATDAKGCSISGFVEVQASLPPSVQIEKTDAGCNQEAWGKARIIAEGGSEPYVYHWSQGGTLPQLDSLFPGDYVVTVSDNIGCAVVQSFRIELLDAFEVNTLKADVTCYAGNNGAALVKPSPEEGSYLYQWSNGSTDPVIQNIMAGKYTVTVTNGKCKIQDSVVIESPPAIKAELRAVHATCFGNNDGAVSTMVQGGVPPYQFLWNNFNVTPSIGQLYAGLYSVFVSDSNGCIVTVFSEVIQPLPLGITFHSTWDTLLGQGAIEAKVVGGVPPYSLSWSNGMTKQTISQLSQGQYSLTVVDNNECVAVSSLVIGPENQVYCSVRSAKTDFEWIQSVGIGPAEHISGNSGGYGDFSNVYFHMEAGIPTVVNLIPGYSKNQFNEYWSIWVDGNQNGNFEEAERLLLSNPHAGPYQSTITLPLGFSADTLRMRIVMQYGSLPKPCGNFAYGEVEDYSVIVNKPAGSLISAPAPSKMLQAPLNVHFIQSDKIKIFPNPASRQTVLSIQSDFPGYWDIQIVSSAGTDVARLQPFKDAGLHHIPLDISSLPAGLYFLTASHNQERFQTKFIVFKDKVR